MYAVQNDTEIKFNIVLYIKKLFSLGRHIQKAYSANANYQISDDELTAGTMMI